MEPEEFVSLFDLLMNGYQPSVLATAIQEFGLHGWDRFGRYGQIKVDTVDVKIALTALAKVYDAMVDSDPYAERWDVAVDHYSTISCYGWMKSVVPDLAKIKQGIVEVPRPQSLAKFESNSVMLMGALLDFIEYGIHSSPHPGFKDFESLATAIETATNSKNGLGRTSTLKKMRDARKAFREQFRQPIRHN